MRYILMIVWISILGCSNEKRLPDMRETYNVQSRQPFGTHIAQQMLMMSYPGATMYELDKAFNTQYFEPSSIYVSITKQFYPIYADILDMKEYVSEGNTLFIAASTFDSTFLDYFDITYQTGNQWGIGDPYMMLDAGVRLSEVNDTLSPVYSYFYYPFRSHFISFPDSATICGYNDLGQPNYIRLPINDGYLYLHAEPRAFSNYFLLTSANYRYFNGVFGGMNDEQETIYWDKYYTKRSQTTGESNSTSYFSELMKHPSLKAATLLFLALMLLYVLLESRRKHPVIPVIQPHMNSSLAFSETIARLYLQHRNHKDIALKMITYFNEYLRSRYGLQSVNLEEQSEWISKKSGVKLEDVRATAYCIKQVHDYEQIDDELLSQLNDYIFKFYK